MHSRRGRGRGIRSGVPRPPVVNEESRINEDTVTGPPPLFPELDKLPQVPDIDTSEDALLYRWHKFRHVCRSGPFFLNDPRSTNTEATDHFAVRKHSDKTIQQQKRPRLASVLHLSSKYFPEELSTDADRRESSRRATTPKRVESVWSEQISTDKDYQRFAEAAKRAEADKKDGTDDESNELSEDKGEDEHSQDDYQQGEYFDDDEGYEDYDDVGDEGPVY